MRWLDCAHRNARWAHCLAGVLAPTGALADDQKLDADFAQRMFAGSVPNPKAYACFARHYDDEHLAQHPLQKVSVMKLLITTEKDPDFPVSNMRSGSASNFRDRPGDFDSSGNCGHAPTIKDPDNSDIPPADRVTQAGRHRFRMRRRLRRRRRQRHARQQRQCDHPQARSHPHLESNAPDAEAAGALQAGADDKVFRLDRTSLNECASLVADRKELAAMRHKRSEAVCGAPWERNPMRRP